MIRDEDIYPIGRLIKAHGLNGEIFYECPQGMPDGEFSYLLIKEDGIIIPFFIENIRNKSDVSGFIKLEDIDDLETTQEYLGSTIYLDRNVIDFSEQKEIQINYFIGFHIIDKQKGNIGKVIDIDESTMNTLFVVEKNNQQTLVPAADDFIINIDHDSKEIFLELPEGLFHI